MAALQCGSVRSPDLTEQGLGFNAAGASPAARVTLRHNLRARQRPESA